MSALDVEETTPGSKLSMIQGIRNGGKIERVVATSVAVSTAWATGKKLYRRARDRRTYSITVKGDDVLYPDIHRWIIMNLPVHKQRSIIVQSTESSEGTVILQGARQGRRETSLRFLFNAENEQTVRVKGHSVKVFVKSEVEEMRRKFSITLTCASIEGREAVMELFDTLLLERDRGERPPRMFIAGRWGDWTRRDDLVVRSLDSVVLRSGVKEELVQDLENFRSHEEDFNRLGLPFHRGYLFQGPAGTGKTSIAKALASHFGMDMYYMPLSDIDADTNLISLVTAVPPGCVLLLEDIDIAHMTRERDDVQKGGTLSGLLNAIDGVSTPHGLIVMMTTNQKDVIDPAMIRPGRVDMEVFIDYVDGPQLSEIMSTFTGEPLDLDIGEYPVSSASVVGEIIRHLDDPDETVKAVTRLFQ